MRKIRVSIGEIGKAAKEIERLRNQIEVRTREFLTKLLQAGVAIASAKIYEMSAIEAGELDSSICYLISSDGKHGIVRADSRHAAYVEFGTGVLGQNNPHPTMPWAYDVNGHGNSGWWYPCSPESPNPIKWQAEDGSWWAWTKGMPSRPFMFETAKELSEQCKETAQEEFGL